MHKNTRIFLHLSLIDGVGPGNIKKLYDVCGPDNFEAIYTYSTSDFRHLGFSQETAQIVSDGLRDDLMLNREILLIEKYGISVMTYNDSCYPSLLKAIHNPPTILYVQGTIPEMPYAGIVGARLGDEYGHSVVRSLVPDLVAAGVGIVSGGAAGIDAFAHQATLDAGGVTVVILGGGLLRPYPASNCPLFTQIVASGGAIVSSFPLQAQSLAWQFPARNRIIAGIAKVTIVVQAAKKSGALITAEYALQEGRSVCAVPGAIDNQLSVGCHNLIAQGARLVGSVQDILEECGWNAGVVPEAVAKDRVQVDFIQLPVLKPQKKRIVQEIQIGAHSQEPSQEIENPLIHHCRRPIASSELSLIMGLSEDEIQQMLFELQLEGKIQQDFAGLWQKI